MQEVVVVRPFGAYRIGDVVTDEKALQKIAASEHAHYVVRVVLPKED